MTNKQLVSYECERLENIRQNLIQFNDKNNTIRFGECIKELGEIIYELTEKIKDEPKRI